MPRKDETRTTARRPAEDENDLTVHLAQGAYR